MSKCRIIQDTAGRVRCSSLTCVTCGDALVRQSYMLELKICMKLVVGFAIE